MRTRFLLPNKLKVVGWIMAIPAFVLMIFNIQSGFEFQFLGYTAPSRIHFSMDAGTIFNLQINNFTDEIGGIILITGLLFIAFSRQKDEDERISQLRLESLLWAVFVNSILLALSIILFYGELFFRIMTYNICTTLILFIARFHITIYSDRKKINKGDYEK